MNSGLICRVGNGLHWASRMHNLVLTFRCCTLYRVVNQIQALEVDPGAVLPNAEAFCLRGSTRLGQGKALEALDDCYRALSLVSVEVGYLVLFSTNGDAQMLFLALTLALALAPNAISGSSAYAWKYSELPGCASAHLSTRCLAPGFCTDDVFDC